MYLVFVAS